MRSRRNENESCSKTARFEAIAVHRSATDEKLNGAPLAYECQTISQCPIQVHLQDPAIGGHQQQLREALDSAARHFAEESPETGLFNFILWIRFYLNRIFVLLLKKHNCRLAVYRSGTSTQSAGTATAWPLLAAWAPDSWYIAQMSEIGYRNQQVNARVVLKISILNIFIND